MLKSARLSVPGIQGRKVPPGFLFSASPHGSFPSGVHQDPSAGPARSRWLLCWPTKLRLPSPAVRAQNALDHLFMHQRDQQANFQKGLYAINSY